MSIFPGWVGSATRREGKGRINQLNNDQLKINKRAAHSQAFSSFGRENSCTRGM